MLLLLNARTPKADLTMGLYSFSPHGSSRKGCKKVNKPQLMLGERVWAGDRSRPPGPQFA